MKYEAVFGNQELFDGAGTFTGLDVVVHSIASGIKSYARSSDLTPESLRNHPVCAMRRIIQEPKRWTVEDQKAGRLPEVGANVEFVFNNEFNYYEPIEEFESGDILDVLAHVCGGNGGMCVAVYNRRTRYTTQLVIESIRPLETPEEKAERLRNEWVDSAYGNTCIFGGTSEGEKQRLKSHLRSVYDSILSGELSVPTKGGE